MMAVAHRAETILAALAEAPASGPLVALHAALLRVQADTEATVSRPSITEPEARARIAAGVPILDTPNARADAQAFQSCAHRVVSVVEAYRPDLHAALAAGVDTTDTGLRAFILGNTERAFLRPAAVALGPFVEDELWHRARCPVCGGEPDLAALGHHVSADVETANGAAPVPTARGMASVQGGRVLLCARCDTEWTYRRIGCPFCGAERPGDVSYHLAGDGAYRLYVCVRCERYLKTVDRRRRRAPCLPVERILTIGLDAVAIEQGYRPAETDAGVLVSSW